MEIKGEICGYFCKCLCGKCIEKPVCFLIEETQCFSTDLPVVAKGAKCMFALNLKVIFHLHPATEGWILDISSKHIYGEGRWGTLNCAYLNMMVISGKCAFIFLYFK